MPKTLSLVDTCYMRKGTREFYRVTHLGALDRPMGLIFCSGPGSRSFARGVNLILDQLVRITPQRFNTEWKAFCLGLATENVSVPSPKKRRPSREGKLNRHFP